MLKDADISIVNVEETVQQLTEMSIELRKLDLEIKMLVQEIQLEAKLQIANEYIEKKKFLAFKIKQKKIKKLAEHVLNKPTLKQEFTVKKPINIKHPKLNID